MIYCKDKSDEIGCHIIGRDDSYQKFLIPPSVNKEDKLLVEISVDILSTEKIESSIDFQFILKMNWLDSRLKFSNLIANKTNQLIPEEMDYIMIPE